MGLVRDLIAISRMKKITRDCVANGRLTQEQADDIWDSAAEAGKRGYAEAKAKQRDEAQRSASVKCCANCRYFSYNGLSSKLEPYTCLQHDIDFTHGDINSDLHHRGVCDNFRYK